MQILNVQTMWYRSISGVGVAVGVVDSGVDYSHDDLKTKFRGYNAGNPNNPTTDYNWHDYGGGSNAIPHDDQYGHGTGVAGVIVGADNDYYYGVAPNAKWIACKVSSDAGVITQSAINSCVEWMLAPTNSSGQGDPAYRPKVVNISVVLEHNNAAEHTAIWNLVTAGTIVTVSSNQIFSPTPTPAPYVPVDAPESYRESYGVGAIAYATPGGTPTLSYFSSRGPASSNFTNLVKPDVVAPGGTGDAGCSHNIYTAYLAGNHAYVFGTSVSSAQVAGIAALILSFKPNTTPGEIEHYIDHGTINGIGHQPDNDYGFGLVNAYGAFSVIPTPDYCNKSFTDVPGSNVFHDDVIFLACGGVVSGYTQSTFVPQNPVTRGQMARIVCLAFGVVAFTPGTPTFLDVPANHWAFTYIESTNHVGIMTGKADGKFHPDDNVQRAEVAVTIYRARGYIATTPDLTHGTYTFIDVPPSHWAYTPIQTLYFAGVVNGVSCGSAKCFNPTSNVRRDELSSFIGHAVRRITNPSPTPSPEFGVW